MASTYTTSLKIQEIGSGEQSGSWGTTTNTNWTLIEQAVAGVQSIVMANANYTLTNLNGVSDEARNMVLVVTGTNSGIYQIVAPLNQPKMYVVYNNTTGGYAITIGASSGSIVTIPNGVTAQVYTDGTNFYSAQTGSAGNFNVNGTLTASGITDTGALSASSLTVSGAASLATGSISGIMTAPTASTGTNTTQIATTAFVATATGSLGTMASQNANNVAITGGTIAGTTITGGSISSLGTPLPVASGGVGAATLTANSVLLGNGTSALQTVAPSTSGNLLVSNGSTWSSASLASSGVKLGLGITGEVWHNLTGTNVANSTYTNSRAYPIMVTIMMHTGSSGNNPSYMYVDGAVVNQSSSGGWTGGTDFTLTTIVPPGKTYSTNSSSAGSLWVELY